MAHFAQLDPDNNKVINVVVVDDMDIVDMDLGDEVEQVGIDRLKQMYGENTVWVKTSYSSSMRVKYASIGDTYNQDLDCFVPPRPYQSWTFSSETKTWEPPVPQPEDVIDEDGTPHSYSWNESKYALDPREAWELIG